MKDNATQNKRSGSRGWSVFCALALAVLLAGQPAGAQAPGLSIQLRAGQPSLAVTGVVNCRYIVQYLPNLAPPQSWQVLSDMVLATNRCFLADTSALGQQRFYRVMLTNSTITVTNATVKAVAAPDSWPVIPPSETIRVAVFTDPDGGSTSANCVNATIGILATNSGFSASTITGAEIRAGALSNYDVVMFPGGSGTGEATALQQTGCSKVEQFVAQGGGYIGTCAGAYLAALGYNTETSWLQIVDAEILDIDHWARGTGMAQIHLVNSTNVILAGFAEYLGAQYINGPLLGPGGSPTLPDYEQDAVFVSDIHDNAPAQIMPGTTCMTTSTYQSGRCVLFSFHPELTPGLEPMDVRAVKWCAGKL